MKKRLHVTLVILLCLVLNPIYAFAQESQDAFSTFPPIEEVTAANNLNQAYGPEHSGHLKNKFLGFYQTSLETDSASTTLYFYTPESCLISGNVVMAVLNSGTDVNNFYLEQGWKTFADENSTAVLALAAPQDGWKNDDYSLLAAATELLSPSSNVYNYYSNAVRTLVGYGDGAAMAMNYLLQKDASDKDNAAQYAAAAFIEPVGYTHDSQKATSSAVCPVLLVKEEMDESLNAFASFWHAQNDGQNVTLVAKQDGQIPENIINAFFRSNTGLMDYITLADKDSADYQGMTLHTTVVDGYVRYYLVYVPESLRASNEKAPLVIAMHGKNSAFLTYVYTSGWMQVAEEENILVAFPISSPDVSVAGSGILTAHAWGRWDDTSFLQDFVVPEIITNYNADASRIYAFGHSSGCCMSIAQAISTGNGTNPFAAVSGTGGWLGYWEPLGFGTVTSSFDTQGEPFVPYDDNDDGVYTMYEKNERYVEGLNIPTFIIYGEKDTTMAWGMRTPKAQPGGPTFVNPGVKRMFEFYTDYYSLGADLDTALSNAIIYREDIYSNYFFKNEEDIPVLRYTITDGKGHSQDINDARMAYQFFKNYTRNEDGSITYSGQITSTDNTNVIVLNDVP